MPDKPIQYLAFNKNVANELREAQNKLEAHQRAVQEIVLSAIVWLNTNYPTHGDGAWGEEFVTECFYGGHIGDMNRPRVLHALAIVERR